MTTHGPVSQNPRPPRVLVVDDSATVRAALTGILSSRRAFTVTSAPDPLIAQVKMKRDRPDVIVLDLEMPGMHGLAFLRKIMAEDPIPVVVCSAFGGRGAEAALVALECGAVAVVEKPRLGVKQFLEESAVRLTDTVRGAVNARLRRARLPLRSVHVRHSADVVLPAATRQLEFTTDTVLALGASTGGTEALRAILEALPPDAPGLVIVQHMPEGFTRAFAQRLDKSCPIEVKEASNGQRLVRGRALIAPGNRHLLLHRSGDHYTVEVKDGPLVSRHRPSVDVLFRSVARAAGPNAVGVLLTGMGDDGAQGLLEMKQAGATTIAQDEATCVVFGMPKEAIQRGAVDEVIPLPGIAARMLSIRGSGRPQVQTRA
jgi:two-component system chemotaxis response regulator CheB